MHFFVPTALAPRLSLSPAPSGRDPSMSLGSFPPIFRSSILRNNAPWYVLYCSRMMRMFTYAGVPVVFSFPQLYGSSPRHAPALSGLAAPAFFWSCPTLGRFSSRVYASCSQKKKKKKKKRAFCILALGPRIFGIVRLVPSFSRCTPAHLWAFAISNAKICFLASEPPREFKWWRFQNFLTTRFPAPFWRILNILLTLQIMHWAAPVTSPSSSRVSESYSTSPDVQGVTIGGHQFRSNQSPSGAPVFHSAWLSSSCWFFWWYFAFNTF